MTKDVQEAVNLMQDEYIKRGYMYSGCVDHEDLTNLFNGDWERSKQTMRELLKLKDIQVRESEAYAIEFTLEERKRLIEENNLKSTWGKKYPNEINRVMEK